ncbi:hypothetical protein SADUNF_Sadunf16G0149600 [Salix dunnii]|uniref:Choline transporter-like protein n=1 Tax=Salix dunnii TaxID=1413687 RepID=A0A835MH19_9ROSI|nr:hypothetical protein SADUNF_Sadunf16G0149600 [Salix dunnii]
MPSKSTEEMDADRVLMAGSASHFMQLSEFSRAIPNKSKRSVAQLASCCFLIMFTATVRRETGDRSEVDPSHPCFFLKLDRPPRTHHPMPTFSSDNTLHKQPQLTAVYQDRLRVSRLVSKGQNERWRDITSARRNSHRSRHREADAATATTAIMGATEPVVERESERREEGDEEEGDERKEEERDAEKGQVLGVKEKVTDNRNIGVNNDLPNRLGDSHVVMMQRLNPTNPLRVVVNGSSRMPTPSPSQTSLPRSTPTPQGIQGLTEASDSVKRKERRILKFYLPQVETASLLSITLAFVWQKAVRLWPKFMVHFILWSSFLLTLSAGILLICFQRPTTDGVGVCLIAFAIGNGLYSCWVTQRIGFCTKILIKSLEPVPKFRDLNQPTYCMLGVGFLWMSLWILAVIGAMNFYFTPLIIIALVLSLAWTAEVMRNIVNLTVSRIAAYGKGFVQASQDTWQLFERREMESIVDSDITSSICFLTGVCSGSICVIVVAAWTAKVHQTFTATLSLLSFFIGYLMTRIAMALPHACVSCYYVCYAENPDAPFFDQTIKDRQNMMNSDREVVVPTPRVPRRFSS